MQIVGYDSGAASGSTPVLILASDESVTTERLVCSNRLTYSLRTRHCAGELSDMSHTPCPNDGAPYCPTHDSIWICAKCTGSCLKPEMDCHEPHVVYLAAFAPRTFKVGVTKEHRLQTRLREQGADRGIRIRTTTDGRKAREIEAGIAATGVPDRVRIKTKIQGLPYSVDELAWQSLIDEFSTRDDFQTGSELVFSYDLDLSRAPIPETLASGTIRAVKGRLLLLERGGTTYVTDMRSLIGYEVQPQSDARQLQSNLGLFNSS